MGVPGVAAVPTSTTRLCLSTACVSHKLGEGEGRWEFPRGEILGPGLRLTLGSWLPGYRVGQRRNDKISGF